MNLIKIGDKKFFKMIVANFLIELRGTGVVGHTSRHKDIIKVIMYNYHFLHSLKGGLPLPIFGWANGKTKHCAPLKNADEVYGWHPSPTTFPH